MEKITRSGMVMVVVLMIKVIGEHFGAPAGSLAAYAQASCDLTCSVGKFAALACHALDMGMIWYPPDLSL